jgi:hypothetical protein
MQWLSPTRPRRWLLVVLLWCLAGQRLAAQTPAPDEGEQVLDNAAAYIDNAIPGNIARLRFDGAYDDHNPFRGELLWAKPGSAGVPLAERSLNYQVFSGYLELMVGDRVSVFGDIPGMFVNPENNQSASGVGDISAGFKVLIVNDPWSTWSFQLTATASTGDPRQGLGAGHDGSLEPAILAFIPLGDKLAFSGQLGYILPLETTDFDSDVLHYGVGLQYRVYEDEHFHITPVVEAVGWTFFGGKDLVVAPDGASVTVGATNQTILDVNLGLRVNVGGHFDVYGGYSLPVFGDKSYEEGFRVEVRFAF